LAIQLWVGRFDPVIKTSHEQNHLVHTASKNQFPAGSNLAALVLVGAALAMATMVPAQSAGRVGVQLRIMTHRDGRHLPRLGAKRDECLSSWKF